MSTTMNALRISTRSIRSSIPSSARPFSTTLAIRSDGIGKDKSHTVDKHDQPNVQTDASKKGMEHRQNSTGGTATSQSDSTNSVAKSKKEFPEQPANNAGIGFQDERGGKGH